METFVKIVAKRYTVGLPAFVVWTLTAHYTPEIQRYLFQLPGVTPNLGFEPPPHNFGTMAHFAVLKRSLVVICRGGQARMLSTRFAVTRPWLEAIQDNLPSSVCVW